MTLGDALEYFLIYLFFYLIYGRCWIRRFWESRNKSTNIKIDV